MTFLLGKHAMFGHDPPMYLRSMTATRCPSPANVQAAIVDPVPPPRITRSYCSRSGSRGKGDEGEVSICMQFGIAIDGPSQNFRALVRMSLIQVIVPPNVMPNRPTACVRTGVTNLRPMPDTDGIRAYRPTHHSAPCKKRLSIEIGPGRPTTRSDESGWPSSAEQNMQSDRCNFLGPFESLA